MSKDVEHATDALAHDAAPTSYPYALESFAAEVGCWRGSCFPINLILARKKQFQCAPDTTLHALVHAARYYVEFCAHRYCGPLDVAHEEFAAFKHALVGEPFTDAEGYPVYPTGCAKS